MLVWAMISTSLTEACSIFIANAGLFRNSRCDFSTLAYALVWRNLLVFLHHLSAYALAVLVLVPHLLGPATLLLLPGLLLLALNGVWITLLLGMACLRFRDVQQIVTSVVQIAMVITPILWPIDQLRGTTRLVFVHLNPLHHCIEVIRAPLLGNVPTPGTYIAVGAIAVVGWIATCFVFARFRERIPYWS
jgi:ABC-type polysaccharide/polyol phosphate export permease